MGAFAQVRILDQRTPQERDRPFLPGAGKTWLLPFYDAFTRMGGVRALHERAVELAGIEAAQAVVDVGCGTGNLSLSVLAVQPDARVTGLDPDGQALRRAARKARRRGVPHPGAGIRRPVPRAGRHARPRALLSGSAPPRRRRPHGVRARALRALRPNGKVTVVDFGGPSSGIDHASHGHGVAHALRHLPRPLRARVANSPAVARNHANGIVTLLAEAGFDDAREVAHADHRFGRVTFVQATRPRTET